MNQVRRISQYLGLTAEESRIKAVVERCSLKNLKEEVEGLPFTKGIHAKPGKSAIYRKGKLYLYNFNNLTPLETVCMIFQSLISGKNKKTISKCRLLNFLPNMQSILIPTLYQRNHEQVLGYVRNNSDQSTVDSRYLELKGTL